MPYERNLAEIGNPCTYALYLLLILQIWMDSFEIWKWVNGNSKIAASSHFKNLMEFYMSIKIEIVSTCKS
jgi:hypothetical protein